MAKKERSVEALVEGNVLEEVSVAVSPEGDYLMTFEQFCDRHRSDIHKYTRAYVGVKVRGTLKTRAGWDEEVLKLEGKA